MSQNAKRTPYIYVEWIGNNSDIYDGMSHWVPKSKLTNQTATIGDEVSIKWYGKIWKGLLKETQSLTKAELAQRISKSKMEKSKSGTARKKPNRSEKVEKVKEVKNSKKNDSGKILCVGTSRENVKYYSKGQSLGRTKFQRNTSPVLKCSALSKKHSPTAAESFTPSTRRQSPVLKRAMKVADLMPSPSKRPKSTEKHLSPVKKSTTMNIKYLSSAAKQGTPNKKHTFQTEKGSFSNKKNTKSNIKGTSPRKSPYVKCATTDKKNRLPTVLYNAEQSLPSPTTVDIASSTTFLKRHTPDMKCCSTKKNCKTPKSKHTSPNTRRTTPDANHSISVRKRLPNGNVRSQTSTMGKHSLLGKISTSMPEVSLDASSSSVNDESASRLVCGSKFIKLHPPASMDASSLQMKITPSPPEILYVSESPEYIRKPSKADTKSKYSVVRESPVDEPYQGKPDVDMESCAETYNLRGSGVKKTNSFAFEVDDVMSSHNTINSFSRIPKYIDYMSQRNEPPMCMVFSTPKIEVDGKASKTDNKKPIRRSLFGSPRQNYQVNCTDTYNLSTSGVKSPLNSFNLGDDTSPHNVLKSFSRMPDYNDYIYPSEESPMSMNSSMQLNYLENNTSNKDTNKSLRTSLFGTPVQSYQVNCTQTYNLRGSEARCPISTVSCGDDTSPHNILKGFSRLPLYSDNLFPNEYSPKSLMSSVQKNNIDTNIGSCTRNISDTPKQCYRIKQENREDIAQDINTDDAVKFVLESRDWKNMGTWGPSLLARNLMKAMFTKEELKEGHMRARNGTPLDTTRLLKIKATVIQTFDVPSILVKAVWSECNNSIVQMLKYCRREKKKATTSSVVTKKGDS